MGKWLWGTAIFAGVALIGATAYLWTPAPGGFDAAAAKDAAQQYDARIIRDKFGVPHIYGSRDADVAFGLAYAHAEDDWRTIEQVIFFSRGRLAEHNGKDAAIPDYLIGALGIADDIAEKYETDLTAETRTLVEGYAAGINLYCAEDGKRCARGAAPVTGQDIIAGFVSRTPFFYGLDAQLTKLFEGDGETTAKVEKARAALLQMPAHAETGSNAMAVAPQRSADGHTRLMVNSHQPYTGPVAWYEARVRSEEGLDIIGGLFPGAPMVLHGARPELGWAFTVNKPDLVDVFALNVDDAKKPTRYRLDGEWRVLKSKPVSFRVKLFGRFSLPVKRKALRSVHGPVFVTDAGVFAVSYGGSGDIRAAEQWYRMNKATNFGDWRGAMAMGAIPSFNVVYADGKGNIAYFYNAAIPVRIAEQDWSVAAPGDESKYLWQGKRPFSVVPKSINPVSGYVVNANHTPFEASAAGDNPDPAAFPTHFGIDTRSTNRGLRIQALYGGDQTITEDEFLRYKFDNRYALDSRLMEMVRQLAENEEVKNDPTLVGAAELLGGWNGEVSRDSRAAALAIFTAQKVRGYLLDDEDPTFPDAVAALRDTVEKLRRSFERIDPEWGDVMRLKRGDVDLAIDGGPDTLRAVYPKRDLDGGPATAAGGDTYILYADWDGNGKVKIQTIHQFGAATLDETSPHYNDQAQLFASEKWKTPPMELNALLAEATADYRPGRNPEE